MYNLKCPDCGYDASEHPVYQRSDIGTETVIHSVCERSEASLYAAECERLAARLIEEENDHGYTVQDIASQRDAARAECERMIVQMAGVGVAAFGGTSESQVVQEGGYGWSVPYQDVLNLRRYKAALEKIATLYDGFVGTSDYRETDEVRIARTALDGGNDANR